MRLLALDCATENCSAALLIDGRLAAREEELERGHAGRILPMIDALLAEAGASLSSLDAIAFGRGPGGFTGVRLAACITQGLAFGAGLGVVPISDLAALAQRAFDEAPGIDRVLACSDARMREVYWACFERDAQGLALHASDERVGKPDTLELPAGWEPRAILGAGRGLRAYPTLIGQLGLERVSVELLPRALEVAILAASAVTAGKVCAPEAAVPVYLRDEVAQVPAKSPP
jgi:tRNA threonylcarbamoyladenosine biosynthesis protein TsaB